MRHFQTTKTNAVSLMRRLTVAKKQGNLAGEKIERNRKEAYLV